MALLRKMRFWKKSSGATSRQASSRPSEVARHAPAARGSALFQEFLARPTDPGPAFTHRLALVSALEERRAQEGGSGYLPMEYAGRPFPDAPPASPGPVKSVDSFDLADINVKQTTEPESEPESQPDSSLSCSRFRPDAVQISSPVFPPREPSDSRRTSNCAGKPSSWTAGDDTAEHFNVVSAVPANGNEALVAPREGSVSSTGGQSDCFSSSASTVAPSYEDDDEEEEEERGRAREPRLLNPGVYY